MTVLTDAGGFLEVYYAADMLQSVPEQGKTMRVFVEVDARKREGSNGGIYAELQARYAGHVEVASGAPPLRATG